ncbi:MAG: hypothetical protein IJP91_09175 [Synergistaceae bacterium]|nr:hypothetical protein [Synergistaceae bacterium]
MKKFLTIALCVSMLLGLSGSAVARPRMAVRMFEDRTEDGDAPAGAVMDMMVTELSKAKVFDLMERERLDYIADEINLGQSGLMDPATAPKVGKIKGVNYTMTGAITLYYYDEKGAGIAIPIIGGASQKKTAYVVLDIRIIDNTTGEIIYTGDQVGTSRRDANGAIAAYKGFYIGGYKRQYGGILGSATREAVMKHVAAISSRHWEE